ncbi:MAG: hypothetical protein BWZ07_02968 [Alphaproteobacteria bacterium ADurb.BinA280]|nr:MAG: hypothetical protein BWZ07_02968 [Alphaproteobacteria bacterium ADurb.BinA280]
MTPKYRNNNTNSEVRRASHVHHVPHIGLPHNDPVSRVSKVNAAPSGALCIASNSLNLMRHTKAMNAFTHITK